MKSVLTPANAVRASGAPVIGRGMAGRRVLPRLPVRAVDPAAGAELAQFQPLRIVPLVLLGRVVTLPTLGTGQRTVVAVFAPFRHRRYLSHGRLLKPGPRITR